MGLRGPKRRYPAPDKNNYHKGPGKPRNEVPTDMLVEVHAPGIGGWGEAMARLDPRRRAFILALYEQPRGHGAATNAARAAGFGTAKSSAMAMAQIASRLMHDDRVIAALEEEDKRRIRRAAPRAIRALERLLENDEHKDHARAIGMTLDRVHPIETRHEVTVTHKIDHDAEAVAELRMLKSLGVAHDKLVEVFGHTGISRYQRMLEGEDAKADKPAPKLIESAAVELESITVGSNGGTNSSSEKS